MSRVSVNNSMEDVAFGSSSSPSSSEDETHQHRMKKSTTAAATAGAKTQQEQQRAELLHQRREKRAQRRADALALANAQWRDMATALGGDDHQRRRRGGGDREQASGDDDEGGDANSGSDSDDNGAGGGAPTAKATAAASASATTGAGQGHNNKKKKEVRGKDDSVTQRKTAAQRIREREAAERREALATAKQQQHRKRGGFSFGASKSAAAEQKPPPVITHRSADAGGNGGHTTTRYEIDNGDPSHFGDRLHSNAMRKHAQRDKEQREHETKAVQRELQDCPFQPKLSAANKHYVGGNYVPPDQRTVREHAQRQLKLQILKRRHDEERELGECRFQPNIDSGSRAIVHEAVAVSGVDFGDAGARLYQDSLWRDERRRIREGHVHSKRQSETVGGIVLPQQALDGTVSRLHEWRDRKEELLARVRLDLDRQHEPRYHVDPNTVVERLTRGMSSDDGSGDGDGKVADEGQAHRPVITQRSKVLAEHVQRARLSELFKRYDTANVGTFTLEALEKQVRALAHKDPAGMKILQAFYDFECFPPAPSSESARRQGRGRPIPAPMADEKNRIITLEEFAAALDTYERRYGPQEWGRDALPTYRHQQDQARDGSTRRAPSQEGGDEPTHRPHLSQRTYEICVDVRKKNRTTSIHEDLYQEGLKQFRRRNELTDADPPVSPLRSASPPLPGGATQRSLSRSRQQTGEAAQSGSAARTGREGLVASPQRDNNNNNSNNSTAGKSKSTAFGPRLVSASSRAATDSASSCKKSKEQQHREEIDILDEIDDYCHDKNSKKNLTASQQKQRYKAPTGGGDGVRGSSSPQSYYFGYCYGGTNSTPPAAVSPASTRRESHRISGDNILEVLYTYDSTTAASSTANSSNNSSFAQPKHQRQHQTNNNGRQETQQQRKGGSDKDNDDDVDDLLPTEEEEGEPDVVECCPPHQAKQSHYSYGALKQKQTHSRAQQSEHLHDLGRRLMRTQLEEDV